MAAPSGACAVSAAFSTTTQRNIPRYVVFIVARTNVPQDSIEPRHFRCAIHRHALQISVHVDGHARSFRKALREAPAAAHHNCVVWQRRVPPVRLSKGATIGSVSLRSLRSHLVECVKQNAVYWAQIQPTKWAVDCSPRWSGARIPRSGRDARRNPGNRGEKNRTCEAGDRRRFVEC